MKFYTSFIALFILFPAFFSANAQEKTSDNWNVKIGYSRINNYSFTSGNIGEFTVEGNYKLNKWLETGLYTGYSTGISEGEEIINNGRKIGGIETSPVLSYGINSNFYLSSLLFSENFRLGFRVILRPGGFIIFSKKDYDPSGHYLTFRPGVGIDFRLFRKMGIFGEYVYGFGDGIYRADWYYSRRMRGEQKHIGSFRFGISIHW